MYITVLFLIRFMNMKIVSLFISFYNNYLVSFNQLTGISNKNKIKITKRMKEKNELK